MELKDSVLAHFESYLDDHLAMNDSPEYKEFSQSMLEKTRRRLGLSWWEFDYNEANAPRHLGRKQEA